MATTTRTPTTDEIYRIAWSHLLSDVRERAPEPDEPVQLDEPVGYRTGAVTVEDDLREIGWEPGEIDALERDEIYRIGSRVTDAYRELRERHYE